MNNSFRITIVCCGFLILSISGCASKPDQELKAATEAMNQAMQLRPEDYAPGDWKNAKDIWDQAQDQLAKQQYAAARESLLTAKARLEKLITITKQDRESVQKEVTDIRTGMESSYAEFKASINPARLSPAQKKDYQAACADIDKRIGILASLMSQEAYIQAKKAALDTVQAINYNKKKLLGK